jgi:hypothetical protein
MRQSVRATSILVSLLSLGTSGRHVQAYAGCSGGGFSGAPGGGFGGGGSGSW